MSLTDTNYEGRPEGMRGAQDVVTLNGQIITPPSKLSPEDRFRVLQSWFRSDSQFSSAWRLGAGTDFEFRAGEQWTEDDKAILRDQLRPIIVFNRVLTILKAVAGMEINGRHDIQFLPVNNEDTAPNEVLSAASKWMAAGCDAEDEQSEAFDNCSTCGMGWTESRITYELNSRGMYVEESIDPLEMYWDRSSRKRNLYNARRIERLKKIPVAEAMTLFPGIPMDQLDASWATELGQAFGEVKSYEQKLTRDANFESWADLYSEDNEVNVVHMQWYELETYYLVADPTTQSMMEMEEKKYETFRQRATMLGMEVTAARLQRRCYYQSFLGANELQFGKSPLQGRFIWQCITGELDRKKGTWFGLIKVMRDPQMWANKWLSQTLHILNTTAKGGIIAEEDAFEDQEQAEETYAKPDSITWAAKGAIAGSKIMEKKGAGITQGHVELMQFAISAIRDCTGINLELLGLKDANQPGVLEAQRKQAGMTVLATLFDSLRRFRKGVGHIRLYYIQNYFADGRLIRVAGPLAAKAIPLLKDKTFGEYQVIIDDTPTSPNQKQANWAVIAPMIGLFKEQLAQKPELLAALLEYSPLPAALVELIKQMVLQESNNPQAQQDKAQMKQLAIQGAVAKINKDQSTAEMNNAKAGATQATASYDLAMAQNLLQKGQFDKLDAYLKIHAGAASVEKAHADADAARAKASTAGVQAQHAGTQAASDHLGMLHDIVQGHHDRQIATGQLANDTASTVADVQEKQARAHAHRVGALTDMLTAMQPPQPQQQSAA